MLSEPMRIFAENIPNGWQVKPFESMLSEPIRNGIYKKKEFHGRGARVVNMGELFGFEFISNQEMKRVELNSQESKNAVLVDGDLLFARRSLILEGAGKCSLVLNPPELTTFESSIIRARPNKEITDPRFLYYLFASPLGRAIMASIATRTAVSGIRGSDLSQLMLPLPPLSIQQRIVSILSAYDDLIENNITRINLLESMARVLYRESVRSGGESLSPQPILESPFWRIISENVSKYSGVKRYYATADIDGLSVTGSGIEYLFSDKPSRAQKQPISNSVWFARMKDSYKIAWYSSTNAEKVSNIILSSGFAGFQAIDEELWPLLFLTLSSKEFHAQKNLFCTGATQMALTNEGLARIKMPLPDENKARLLGADVASMLSEMAVLQESNDNLRNTRNLLLSRFLSGQIDVETINS